MKPNLVTRFLSVLFAWWFRNADRDFAPAVKVGAYRLDIEPRKVGLSKGEHGVSVFALVGAPPESANKKPVRGMVFYHSRGGVAGKSLLAKLALEPVVQGDAPSSGFIGDEVAREIRDFCERMARVHGCIVHWSFVPGQDGKEAA